jgi:hypothetical protein
VLRCVGPRHRDEANDLRIAVHLEAALVVGARSRRKEEPPRCKRRLRCGRSWRCDGLPPCSHALRRKGRALEWEQPSRFPARSARTKKKAPSVSAAPSSSAERKRLTHRVRRQDARGIETAGS